MLRGHETHVHISEEQWAGTILQSTLTEEGFGQIVDPLIPGFMDILYILFNCMMMMMHTMIQIS